MNYYNEIKKELIDNELNKKVTNTILSIILTAFIHTLFNCLREYSYFPISKSVISIYITIFEYYIIIMGLYIYKKKIDENNAKIKSEKIIFWGLLFIGIIMFLIQK